MPAFFRFSFISNHFIRFIYNFYNSTASSLFSLLHPIPKQCFTSTKSHAALGLIFWMVTFLTAFFAPFFLYRHLLLTFIYFSTYSLTSFLIQTVLSLIICQASIFTFSINITQDPSITRCNILCCCCCCSFTLF